MAQSQRSEGEVVDGRYRLGKRLGRGGFGDVWRAEELLPDGTTLREVALKLLHGSIASSPDWSAEARIIASLRHPALVTVYSAGVLHADRAIPFVAMELLIGDNLGDLVAGDEGRVGTVPWRRVLSWAREAAAALDVIHLAGVVHLDLKPANLFLADEAIKVLDFGIARQGTARAPSLRGDQLPIAPPDELGTAAFLVQQAGEEGVRGADSQVPTTARAVVGTPGFMAPEIFEEGEASPATDAYALAACVVQLCTGRLPQEVAGMPPPGDPSTTVGSWFADVQAATVRGRIRDLAHDHPELPQALARLLCRWLALDPVQRQVPSGSLRAALDEVWNCPGGWTGNPYQGLETHTFEHEGKLYARGPDIARIGRELVENPGVVLYGDGAIGLSSLAKAGIVPEVARHFADAKHDWIYCEVPFSEIDATTSADDVLERALATFLEHNEAAAEPAHQAIFDYAAGADTGVVVLIEDLHRLVPLAPRDSEALDALIRRVAAGASGMRVVATLDAEHASALAELTTIGEVTKPWLRFIGPIQASAVGELVHGPARARGVAVVGIEVLVDDLQDEIAQDGSRLPLISLALQHWWDLGERDAQSWTRGGAVLGQLCRHADAVFDELAPKSRAIADHVLLRMVSVDGQVQPVAESRLLEAADDSAALARVVTVLLSARLVRREHGRLRLSHIGLATAWPRLNDLRLHDVERLTFVEDLRNAARSWQLGGRHRKNLWPSDNLRRLGRRRSDVDGELDDTEREFLTASMRQRRIGWMAQATVLAMFFVFVGLGYYVNIRVEARERVQQTRLEDARKAAALGRMVTASRRTKDPYHRVALLSGAIAEGSKDPLLAVELLEAGRDLPAAEFMSLSRIERPAFPWGERWLVGSTQHHLVLYDFQPPAGDAWAPLHYRFQPHQGALTDIVPFAFDTALVTRDQRGEVKVWRLGEEGQVMLAAIAPERCVLGPILVSRDQATVVCSTASGVARWDLDNPGQMTKAAFRGRALAVSADGRWVVAARLKKLLLWNHETGDKHIVELQAAPKLASVSERDALAAVVSGSKLEVFMLEDASVRIRRDVGIREPVTARWAKSGIDLAVCDYGGEGEWHYLRRGARAASDPPLPRERWPCEDPEPAWPKRLRDVADYGSVGFAQVGPRVFEGGWQLEDGTMMTHDLVMFGPKITGLRRQLRLRAEPKERRNPGASATAVFRDGEAVIWQVGDYIRRHDAHGVELARWRGHLLMRCDNGRLLAWRRQGDADDAPNWEIFAARVGVVLATVPRVPGIVLGADPGCHRVFFQSSEGKITALDLDNAGPPKPVESPGGGYVLEGYVYDVRPSQARTSSDKRQASGVWMAMSAGALIRVDGASGSVFPYGHATPRASAMADGPAPADLIFADDRGVVLRHADGDADRLLLGPLPGRRWEDIALSPDGRTLWLSWADGVTVVDLAQGDILGELEVSALDRFARWDDGGSLMLWPYSYRGQPAGQVIPIGLELAAAVGVAASNVRARLQDARRAVIRLDE